MAITDEGSSTYAGKRGRKSTSIVWNYFEKLPIEEGMQNAKCIKCERVYQADPRSGTSNMIRHVRRCFQEELNELDAQCVLPLDQEMFREKLAIAIIKHNLPFSFVEYEGIRDLHSFLNPQVKTITRNTGKADVLQIYKREKENLKILLELNCSKICLTTNLWSALTTDGYMTVTAHYVDEDWVLQKRVLIFRHVPPPHSGLILAEKLINFLKEWGVEKKIFTITLDNAKYNDGLVGSLKDHFSLTNSLICGGEFVHVRCGAHILNLIVQSGLKVIDESVFKIRETIKYVRGTAGRKIKFAECISELSLECGKKVCQDVPTRWNSTYLMLESALVYRQAFFQLQLVDPNFKNFPSIEEWGRVERIARFLKPFYDITTLFSGTHYPTANLYFQNVWKIQLLIQEEMRNPDNVTSCMAREMKEKFDKYWECYSVVLSLAIILDPRYKLQMVEFCFAKLNPATAGEKVANVREKLYFLFEEYMQVSPSPSASRRRATGVGNDTGDEMDDFDLFWAKQRRLNINKSQLELYLDEPFLERKQHLGLDVLCFWKENRVRYPELSLMARDVLSIPITSVASESAFSVGGQIINKYHSSIMLQNVEALLCTRDWLFGLRGDLQEDEEELTEDFQKILSELGTTSTDLS